MNMVIIVRDTVVEIQILNKILVYKYSYRWALRRHFVFGCYQENTVEKLQLWWIPARVKSVGSRKVPCPVET